MHFQCYFAGEWNKNSNLFRNHSISYEFHSFRYDSNEDKQLFDAVKAIACELGVFLQARNDFLDCFADEVELLFKPPVDIKSGICTWLSSMAMELGTDQQKAIMQKYYGKNCKRKGQEREREKKRL